MVRSEATSVTLRPTRSPKWPNKAEPIGRAIKAMAKVTSDCSVAAVDLPEGKDMWEDDNGCCGIDIKIKEFNSSANEGGDHDLLA